MLHLLTQALDLRFFGGLQQGFRMQVGDMVYRLTGALGFLKQMGECGSDLSDLVVPFSRAVTGMVHGDMDQATGVEYIVRRVQDAALAQTVSIGIGRQLVVGTSGHNATVQARNGVAVEGGAQTTGAENIGAGIVDRLGIHRTSIELMHAALAALRIDIRDIELGTGIAQPLRQCITHMTKTLYGNTQTGKIVFAKLMQNSGLDPLEYTQCRMR